MGAIFRPIHHMGGGVVLSQSQSWWRGGDTEGVLRPYRLSSTHDLGQLRWRWNLKWVQSKINSFGRCVGAKDRIKLGLKVLGCPQPHDFFLS